MTVVWFLLGVVTGIIITSIICRFRSKDGILRIDHSDPEKDVYRFDVNDLDSLSKKKRIVLKVDNHAELSQK